LNLVLTCSRYANRTHQDPCTPLGDGHITHYETSEQDRKQRSEVVYTNKTDANLREFKNDMQTMFDVDMVTSGESIKVKSCRVAEMLEEQFGSVGTEDWTVPESTRELTEEKKLEWLRAFIRDEGYHDETGNRLRIKSMNREGLSDVETLFESIGVSARITGPNCDSSWYLTVPK
jgi:hypothetical protein